MHYKNLIYDILLTVTKMVYDHYLFWRHGNALQMIKKVDDRRNNFSSHIMMAGSLWAFKHSKLNESWRMRKAKPMRKSSCAVCREGIKGKRSGCCMSHHHWSPCQRLQTRLIVRLIISLNNRGVSKIRLQVQEKVCCLDNVCLLIHALRKVLLRLNCLRDKV